MPYAIGPFTVNEDAHTVTLAPGTYTLTEPLTFGLPPVGVLTGVTYVGTADAPEPEAPQVGGPWCQG